MAYTFTKYISRLATLDIALSFNEIEIAITCSCGTGTKTSYYIIYMITNHGLPCTKEITHRVSPAL